MWTYLYRYVHNLAYPEGFMIEAYTKAINCCTKYIRDRNTIGLLIHLHEGRTSGMGCPGRKVCTDVAEEILQEAHHNSLNQLVVIKKWVEKNLEELHHGCDGCIKAWV